MKKLQKADIDEFKARFSGKVILRQDAQYNEVRQIWNGMIDRKPSFIARCLSPDDVVQAVLFARKHDQIPSIRGGGHNIAGNAVSDGGMMIDLSLMKSVHIDEKNRRASVEPGCTLADFDGPAQEHGLATPLGINSTTGVAGLTLGGGFGWLSRKYGMTVDNLLSAEVVMADGKKLRASETENPELFWGLRGGGGNFGIVTRFEFQLHPVGPEVLSGLIVFPYEQAKAVITQFARFAEHMPDELSVWLIGRQAPPLPFLPATIHGKEVIVLALCYAGDPVQGEKLIAPLRTFATPHGEHLGVQPYAAWQQAFDPLLGAGARNYWKSHNLTQLKAAAIDLIIEYVGTMPSPQCEIFVAAIGGQTARVSSEAMAYSGRDAKFVLNVHGRWDSPDDDAQCIAWAREFFAKSKPFASAGVYINFLTEDETDRISASYGSSYDRLRQIKKKYDPENFFRINQNIKPA